MHRILFLEHSTDGTIGGSHLCLLDICRHIDREKYQVVVCFFETNPLIAQFEAAGAEVMILELPGNWEPPSYLPRGIARPAGFAVNLVRTILVRALKWMRLIKQRNIDIVHINNACGYDHDLMVAARVMKKVCIVHERGIQPFIDFRTRYFANHVDTIIAISDAVFDNLRNQGVLPERIIRIDDGIHESRFQQHESQESVRKRLGIDRDSPVIGIVGNIKRWKGQHVVVEAMGILMRRYPDLRCLFVGSIADGKYHQELIALANKIGVPESALIFTGYEQYPADLMRVMDVVIHASIEPEPFGIVLLEAMGCERPHIATNIGGPREIVVNSVTGVLVPPGNAAELANAVTKLLDDRALAAMMAQRGRLRYLHMYTIQNNVMAIESLYERFVKSQAPSQAGRAFGKPGDRSLVATLGPLEDKPWWWGAVQLDENLCPLDYQRIVFHGKRSQDIHTHELPAVFFDILRHLLRWRRQYDYVFSFECDLVGFAIAFWQSILRIRKPKHIILQFIMRERRQEWKSTIKYMIMKAVFSSVHKVVVSSSGELDYYREAFGWDADKIVFVPFHANPDHLRCDARSEGDYVIAAGRSFRDYQTLVDAIRDTKIKVIIVGGSGAVDIYSGLDNLEVMENIPVSVLNDLIMNARAVVVPLEDRRISIGQSVILQAMSFGKAVIATETTGTVDYIRNMETGILVPPYDVHAMKAALHSLEDESLRRRLGSAAREHVERNHLPHHYTRNIREALFTDGRQVH